MKKVSSEQLKAISEAIVRVADPLLVVLIGSRSRGTAEVDSDLDLLVVAERPRNVHWSRRRAIGDMRRSLPRLDFPVDILFFTPEEFTRWSDTTNHIVHRALSEGNVLYERP